MGQTKLQMVSVKTPLSGPVLMATIPARFVQKLVLRATIHPVLTKKKAVNVPKTVPGRSQYQAVNLQSVLYQTTEDGLPRLNVSTTMENYWTLTCTVTDLQVSVFQAALIVQRFAKKITLTTYPAKRTCLGVSAMLLPEDANLRSDI